MDLFKTLIPQYRYVQATTGKAIKGEYPSQILSYGSSNSKRSYKFQISIGSVRSFNCSLNVSAITEVEASGKENDLVLKWNILEVFICCLFQIHPVLFILGLSAYLTADDDGFDAENDG
jgi:hypothetical protein